MVYKTSASVFLEDISRVNIFSDHFDIHHNLFITQLLKSKVKAVLAKQLCCIQNKKCLDYIEK